MGWKEDNRGAGPWPFVAQPNKWGYLNNPNWMIPPNTPVSYDGREDEEPQIWDYESGSPIANKTSDPMHTHIPCGHWHKPVLVPTTPPPVILYPWFSCPQTVVYGNGTDDIFFITTDHDNPTSILYLVKYNRSTSVWEVLYTTTQTWGDVDARWTEPHIAEDTRGNISVFGFFRQVDVAPDYPYVFEIFVFNGETLLNNTLLYTVTPGAYVDDPYYCSDWLCIDSAGRIHVLFPESVWPNVNHYDYVSSDNGATFTPHLIVTGTSSNRHFICTDLSGNLWALTNGGNGSIYKSTDNGTTWALSSVSPVANVTDFDYLNDALFILAISTTTATIYRSTDGVNWNLVLTFPFTLRRGGALVHNGSFYFAIFHQQDVVIDATPSRAGSNHVYRSADGISWSEVSTFDDETKSLSTAIGSFNIDVYSGKMVCTYYYAATYLSGYTDVFMKVVWESSDNGITWNQIQTPFYDLILGVAPY